MFTVGVMTVRRKGKAKASKQSNTASASAKQWQQSKTGGSKKSLPSATTADPALSAKVLQGTLLSQIGRCLSVLELVATSAVNKAFRHALSSDSAWQDATWDLEQKDVKRLYNTYNPASVAKLKHLTLDSEVSVGREPFSSSERQRWLDTYGRFLSRLPSPMAALTTLVNVGDISAVDLQSKFPNVQTLTLLSVQLTAELLTALQRLKYLRTLGLLGDCPFKAVDLVSALPLLQHAVVHLFTHHAFYQVRDHQMAQVLTSFHHLSSLTLTLSVMEFEEFVDKHPAGLGHPPTNSRLSLLSLTLFWDDEQPTYHQLKGPGGAQLADMFRKCVLAFLSYYPAVGRLELTSQSFILKEDKAIANYCRSRGLAVDWHFHVLHNEEWMTL